MPSDYHLPAVWRLLLIRAPFKVPAAPIHFPISYRSLLIYTTSNLTSAFLLLSRPSAVETIELIFKAMSELSDPSAAIEKLDSTPAPADTAAVPTSVPQGAQKDVHKHHHHLGFPHHHQDHEKGMYTLPR